MRSVVQLVLSNGGGCALGVDGLCVLEVGWCVVCVCVGVDAAYWCVLG